MVKMVQKVAPWPSFNIGRAKKCRPHSVRKLCQEVEWTKTKMETYFSNPPKQSKRDFTSLNVLFDKGIKNEFVSHKMVPPLSNVKIQQLYCKLLKKLMGHNYYGYFCVPRMFYFI